MKTKDIRQRLIGIEYISLGYYNIVFTKRHRMAVFITEDSEIVDAIKFKHTRDDKKFGCSYTEREALMLAFKNAK